MTKPDPECDSCIGSDPFKQEYAFDKQSSDFVCVTPHLHTVSWYGRRSEQYSTALYDSGCALFFPELQCFCPLLPPLADIWGFQHILWSNITPRNNLFSYTLSMSTLSIITCMWMFILWFQNTISLVLFRFNNNLFRSNHHFNLFILDMTIIKSCCKSSPEQKILVSSANTMYLLIYAQNKQFRA